MPESARQAARLLFLHAQTGLHPGSGTALGVVDMPIQRERHTDWPAVPGSALKGILRDRCREAAKRGYTDDGDELPEQDRRTARRKANEDDPDLVAAFGPGKGSAAADHAGALAVTDARLAAFPVRSLRGVFAWVTCPAVLTRLNRDLRLAGQAGPAVPPVADREQLLCAAESPLRIGDAVVLEEFEYTVGGACDAVARWFATHATADPATAARLASHLAVIHDDAFTHYARHATEVVARVGLDYATKTVKAGALFYQEVLPAETLLYAVVLANPSRRDQHPKSAEELLTYLGEHLGADAVVQIGGDETVGKGLCFAHLTDGKGE